MATANLGTLNSTTASQAVSLGGRTASVQLVISGSTSAQVQVSNDKTNWVNSGSAQTSSGIVDVSGAYQYLRVNNTYTSGTGVTITVCIRED